MSNEYCKVNAELQLKITKLSIYILMEKNKAKFDCEWRGMGTNLLHSTSFLIIIPSFTSSSDLLLVLFRPLCI